MLLINICVIIQSMNIGEFNYYFTIRDAHETGLQIGVICKDLGYNDIDKNKVLQTFGISNEETDSQYYVKNITRAVETTNAKALDRMRDMCNQLQEKWDSYREEFLQYLSLGLDITFNKGERYNTYCQLQLLPINEIDTTNNIIYLDCNKSVDEAFKTFIIMVTKAMLLDRWRYINKGEFSYEFDRHNKIWLFAEIAVDAIFANTSLSKVCENPSYKYFYNIIINNTCFMQEFRKLYTKVSLEDFFTSVYMFVHENYDTISKFKNYLY